jgi:hypothetical protein
MMFEKKSSGEIIPVAKPRRCQKCGNMLSQDEETICLFCSRKEDIEDRQANEDKQRWWKREQEEDW